MTAACAGYIPLLWFVMGGLPERPDEVGVVLTYALLGVGFVTCASSFVIRAIRLSPAKVARELQKRGLPAAVGDIVTTHFAVWGIAECVSLYGLVLGFLGGGIAAYVLLVLGVLALMAHYPTEYRINDLLDSAAREMAYLDPGSDTAPGNV